MDTPAGISQKYEYLTGGKEDGNRHNDSTRVGLGSDIHHIQNSVGTMSNGKGDSLRPVDKVRYNINFDEIKWNVRCARNCKGCPVSSGHTEKKGMVCRSRQVRQEPKQIHLRSKREEATEDSG